MSVPIFIEWFVALELIVLGVSHMVQPRLWTQLFRDLLGRPYAGLLIGTFTLPFGVLTVLGHNIWVLDLPVIVTVIGWGWLIKGLLYMIHPSTVQKVASRHMEHPKRFVIAGALAVVIGGAVMIDLVAMRWG